SATDAHGDDSVSTTASAELTEDGCGHARSRDTEGVSECDGAAIGVGFLFVEPELSDAVQRLRCECFVEFDHRDIVDGEVVLREQFAYCGHRPNPHFVWMYTDDMEAEEFAENFRP